VVELVYNKILMENKIADFVSPLFIATNSTHFLYCCIYFFSLQQLLFLQQIKHIFHNYFLLIFIIIHIFLLLLLSISKVQISLLTFYFSPYVTGMLFQLVLNYLQVAGSWNTTFFLSHSSYRYTFIFKLDLFFACNCHCIFLFHYVLAFLWINLDFYICSSFLYYIINFFREFFNLILSLNSLLLFFNCF
jgi:hypothetical protein